MKRKRGDIIGDDGELLTALPHKRKRGDHRFSNQQLAVIGILLFVGVMLLIRFNTTPAQRLQRIADTISVGQSPQATPQVLMREVTISAQAAWQSTDIDLLPGDRVEILYITGEWIATPGNAPSGPEAVGYACDQADCVEPLRGFSQTGMIGRLDADGEIFPVGGQASFTAETAGVLQMRINDAVTSDNSGNVTMRVTVKRYNG